MSIQFYTDLSDTYSMMATGRCDNGCIWNSDVHSYKTEREVSLEQTLDVKTCWKCYNSQPESLEALCRSKIVSSEMLVKMACLVLPSIHFLPLMQYAARRFDALQDMTMKSALRILIEHWPFRVLDVSAVTRKMRSVQAVRELAVETISSGNLKNELVASDCDDVLDPCYNPEIWGYSSFLEYIRKRVEEYAINKENLERKYVLLTSVTVSSYGQLEAYVQHLRFIQQSTNSPFDIRIVKIACIKIKVKDLLELFSLIDPKYVESVSVTDTPLTVRDIHRLTAILKEFQNLTTLYLELGHSDYVEGDDAYYMSYAVSALIDIHRQGITRLHLRTFPMSGQLELYRLPMFLKELRLCWTHMTVDDYEQFANLYHFPVLTRFSLREFYLCDGLVKFISNHASTLTKLDMTFAMDHDSSHMKALADHLRRFGILQDFTYEIYGFENPLDILPELIENFLPIESLTHLHLMTDACFEDSGYRQMMRDLVERISAERKKPFDFCCIENIL